ncbi:DUF2784 domain-containing protein [Acidithiobacillus ferrooxidans F221]|uniref:DUF2784 domain-containing protein n=1 Tax=Acidithiobacillus ferrooxidans TaxID=920 RepID=UPI001C0786D4|nr:DUF2784 domain-containing protein [Acidithiobacillus ferrooxidans]MBU2807796.1 DUF2784 domain-containing protein [Acidithiobacillus ferrooxidans F221]
MQNELWLAQAILVVHILIIAFNVFGLIAIPLGAWRGWWWVRIFWWRALHLAALLVVAVQALLGTACFLTIWQSELQEAAGRQGYRLPLIQTWVDHLLFWHLPMSFFTSIYVLIWIGVLLLWWKVPPVLPWRRP